MAGKNFTNRTKNYMNVTLLIRQGDNIGKPSLEQTFPLNAGETRFVEYGNATNIYLNGLILEYKDVESQSLTTAKQEVIATGTAPTFDWVLNTHSNITINSADGLDISASN